MATSSTTNIRFFFREEILQGILKCFDYGSEVKLQFTYEEVDLTACHEFPFSALTKVRLKLEQHGMKLICEGSRYDVYPSGMQLESFEAFEIRISEAAVNSVYILDDTKHLDKVATVKEQENFYNRWLDSIN